MLRYGAIAAHVLWVPAAVGSYSRARSLPRDVRAIVLHSAECAESNNAAEALASWSASPEHPKASWHFAVDADSTTQSVELDDIAWHAGQVNGWTIGIEQAGRASQTREQWLDPYSRKMLCRVAELIAVLAGAYDIPIERMDPRDPNAKGIFTHADVTRAFAVRGGHTDPGHGYPFADVLKMAADIQRGAYA